MIGISDTESFKSNLITGVETQFTGPVDQGLIQQEIMERHTTSK